MLQDKLKKNVARITGPLCIVFFSMHLVELLQALEHFVQKRSSYSIYAVVKFRKIELL